MLRCVWFDSLDVKTKVWIPGVRLFGGVGLYEGGATWLRPFRLFFFVILACNAGVLEPASTSNPVGFGTHQSEHSPLVPSWAKPGAVAAAILTTFAPLWQWKSLWWRFMCVCLGRNIHACFGGNVSVGGGDGAGFRERGGARGCQSPLALRGLLSKEALDRVRPGERHLRCVCAYVVFLFSLFCFH